VRLLYRATIVILAVIAVAFVSQRIFGDETVTPHLVSSRPVAAIGEGEGAVAVAEDGTILAWFPPGDEANLPVLPIGSAPKGPRVQGPVLEQVRVLAAAPGALRPYVAATRFGESGVDVELTSGIELRFGSAGQAERKWRAVAAVLADPTLTAVDYVNVLAPSKPSTGGSGHALPPLP